MNNKCQKGVIHKGAFTNDVIILGRRGFGKDDGRRGIGLKMTSLFNMVSGENFKQFDLKKVGFIIRKVVLL